MGERGRSELRSDGIKKALKKAKLALIQELGKLLQNGASTQSGAAKLAGIAQPDISALVRGKENGFSIERLFRLLNMLGRRIVITVKKSSKDPVIEVKTPS